MKFTFFKSAIGGSVLMLFLSACALTSTSSPVEVDPLSEVGTTIAQTAAVAQTQTASALPSTATPTQARIPVSTLIAAPLTATPFQLFTSTPDYGIPVETLDPSFNVTSDTLGISGGNNNNPNNAKFTGEPWTCGIRTVVPRGEVYKPSEEFYAYWTVVNTGTKVWTSNTIDFVFLSGYRQKEQRIQDLSSTIGSGDLVTFKVLFKAPRTPGGYVSIWSLRVGSTPFCSMKIYFDVQ